MRSPGHVEPAVQVRVLRKELLHLRVGLPDVVRVARQRDPAERPLAAAEERPDVGRHEAREGERVLDAFVERDLADVVAVVDDRDAERSGSRASPARASRSSSPRRRAARACCAGSACAAFHCATRPAGRQVAVDEVVRRGLVGDQVGPEAARLRPLQQLGQQLGGVAEQADRDGALGLRVARDARERVVEVARLLVEVLRAQAKVDARLLALDVERRRAGEGRRERLRAAHAAEAGGEDPAPREIAAVMLPARLDEGLVRPLDDALAADVDPRAGRHLAEHHQALAVELVEVLPGRPLRHQVRVGDQHARRIDRRAEHADRLAGLHEQRLVLAERAQRLQDRLEARPVARRLADAAVDDERVGVLGDLGVEVVLDHPVRRFDQPVAAGDGAAARRAHGVRAGEGRCGRKVGHGGLRRRRSVPDFRPCPADGAAGRGPGCIRPHAREHHRPDRRRRPAAVAQRRRRDARPPRPAARRRLAGARQRRRRRRQRPVLALPRRPALVRGARGRGRGADDRQRRASPRRRQRCALVSRRRGGRAAGSSTARRATSTSCCAACRARCAGSRAMRRGDRDARECGLYATTAGRCDAEAPDEREAMPAHALRWWAEAPQSLAFDGAGWWISAGTKEPAP